jgi:hypothetical protein
VYRAAFNAVAVASGSEQFPNAALMLDLARQATKIVRDSQRSCSLSYELYAVQLCNAADRVMLKLTEKEATFFWRFWEATTRLPMNGGLTGRANTRYAKDLYREMFGEEDYRSNIAPGCPPWLRLRS